MNGFVDLQVNGWRGIDFSAPGLTLDQVREITRELTGRGTIAYCPTLITAAPAAYEANFPVIAQAMADDELAPHILGIHLEGPFISPEPGAVGAHPKEHVLPPSIEAFDQFQDWADGHIRLLTVAPGTPGCVDLIRHAVDQEVAVSLGHHLATDDQMQAAVDAGARLCTHVGNGIPHMIHRHDNPLWWQLSCNDVSGMFITDGHHLPADLIAVALRSKGVERFIVTSDASPLAGMPPGNYTIFGGLEVEISKTGRISAPSTGGLAGSHASMLECMNHLAGLDLLSARELWQVGAGNALAALDLSPARILDAPGPDVHFDGRRFSVSPPPPSTS